MTTKYIPYNRANMSKTIEQQKKYYNNRRLKLYNDNRKCFYDIYLKNSKYLLSVDKFDNCSIDDIDESIKILKQLKIITRQRDKLVSNNIHIDLEQKKKTKIQ